MTADRAFATMWSETPDKLARRIRSQIRNAFDTMGANGFGQRGDDERDFAIAQRQAGDAALATDPFSQNRSIDRLSKKTAPTGFRLLRLADLLRATGRADEAAAILAQAQSAKQP